MVVVCDPPMFVLLCCCLFCTQVTPTLALYDTMQYVRSPTATVCYGMCLGMGGFLLTAGGEKVRADLLHVHTSVFCVISADSAPALPLLPAYPVFEQQHVLCDVC